MSKKRVTTQQIEFVISNYPNMSTKKIVEEIGLSKKQVEYIAYRNNLHKDKEYEIDRSDAKLSLEQKSFIKENYSSMSNKEICEKINCDKNSLRNYAVRNKLTKNSFIYNDNSILSVYQKQYIKDNYDKKDNIIIATELGITTSQVNGYGKSLKLKKDKFLRNYIKSILTLEQKQFIIQNYSIMTNKDIIKQLGITNSQLKSYAGNKKLIKNLGYKGNNEGYFKYLLEIKKNEPENNLNNFINKYSEIKLDKSLLYKSKYGKYFINKDYFSKIDNEFKAYWLGFLYADGCVRLKNKEGKNINTLSLSLQARDESHLNKFVKSIQSDIPIIHTCIKEYEAVKFSVCNKTITEDLARLGCIPNKSLVLKFPNFNQVPKFLMRHFIRGYFDGDGCIYINKESSRVSISMLGTYEFLESLINFIYQELKINHPKIGIKKDNNAYNVSYSNVIKCEKIYKYLYTDCNIYLDRKLEKFNTLYCLG